MAQGENMAKKISASVGKGGKNKPADTQSSAEEEETSSLVAMESRGAEMRPLGTAPTDADAFAEALDADADEIESAL
jgi:hypothetical protein